MTGRPGVERVTGDAGPLGATSPLVVRGFSVPFDRAYDPRHHFWVSRVGERVRIGMDALGQELSGTIAFLSLRPEGTRLRRGESFGSIESQKFVGQLVSPIDGVIKAVNPRVLEDPRQVHADPFASGWLVELEEVDPRALDGLVHGEVEIRAYFRDAEAEYRSKGVLSELEDGTREMAP